MSLRKYPQREQVELRLRADPNTERSAPLVRRVDGQVVRLDLPGVNRGELADLELPSPAGSLLLTAFLREPAGLMVRTSTEAFGFVSQYNPATGLLLVDFFPDPLGNRWRETAPRQTPALAPAPTPSPSPQAALAARPAAPVTTNAPAPRPAASSQPDPTPQPVTVASATEASPAPESPSAVAPPQLSQARGATEPSESMPEQRTVPRSELAEGVMTEVRRPLGERQRDDVDEGAPLSGLTSDLAPGSAPDAPPDPILPVSQETPQVREPIHAAIPEMSEVPAPLSTPSAVRSPIMRVGPEQAAPAVLAPDRAPVRDIERLAEPPVDPPVAPSVDSSTDQVVEPVPIPSDVSEQPEAPLRREPVFRQPVIQAEPTQVEETESAPMAETMPEHQPGVDTQTPEAAQDQPEAASEPGPLETPTPIPPPQERPEDLDEKFRRLFNTAKAAMMNSEFDAALPALRALSEVPEISDKMREEVLYDLGDALFGLHLDDLADNFGPIAHAYERAMNFNPKSRRTALALRNLGVLHLRVNNLPEARAYFNVLSRDYPHDPIVPTTDYYLGQYFLDRGDYDQAADHFQIVVQNHPEHSIAQPSSVGLAKALNALGYDEQAFQVMDFMEKRWPRYYIDEPELLELAGIIALRVNELESAKQRLLTYYNLIPDTPEAHMLLARIGDIYLLSGQPEPAKRVFERAVELYPDQEGGLIAKMRLVEGGIHDEPSLDDIFAMRRAAEVYSEIISKHPDSPLAAVATVKLAIWQIWNKRLEDSLMVINEFLVNRPNHSLVPKALEVGVEAFNRLVERNAEDGRYSEILEQWRENVFLHDLLDDMPPGTQLGLAMGYWTAGDLEQAIALARPYLRDDTPKELQIAALDLILGIFLEQQEWARIVELAPLRNDLPGPQRRELTYSVVLGMENLGRSEDARPLWLGLAEDMGLGDAQRGYALYFLARTAMQEEDFERVYLYAQEALSLLLLDREDPGKIRDAVTWLTQVTKRTGRLHEALAWALELDQLIDRSDPEWSISRYRLAQLYQRAQNHAEWKAVLEDLKAEDPQGLYGRLAASALQGRTLEDSAGRFF